MLQCIAIGKSHAAQTMRSSKFVIFLCLLLASIFDSFSPLSSVRAACSSNLDILALAATMSPMMYTVQAMHDHLDILSALSPKMLGLRVARK